MLLLLGSWLACVRGEVSFSLLWYLRGKSSSLLNAAPFVEVRLVPTLERERVVGAFAAVAFQSVFQPLFWVIEAAAAFWFVLMDLAVRRVGSALTFLGVTDFLSAGRAMAYVASIS